MMRRFSLFVLAAAMALVNGVGLAGASPKTIDESQPQKQPSTDLDELSLGDLLNVEVSSASRKLETLSKTSAAIFVITQRDIRRMGATSLPEALRMVPGLHVAHIDANK